MLRRLAQHRVRFFIVTFGLSLGASVAFTSALSDILPIDGLLYTGGLLPVVVVMAVSLLITMFMFALRAHLSWPDEGMMLLVSAAASGILTFLFVVASLFFQGERVNLASSTVDDIDMLDARMSVLEDKMGAVESDLARMGLSIAQIQQLESTYVKNEQLTVADLTQLGLNQTQMAQVESLLESEGFLTKNDLSIEATVIAMESAVNAQATEEATCYIQPINYDVNVRKTPELPEDDGDDNFLTSLLTREKVRVIGHNGGDINADRWWLIELSTQVEGKKMQGWVASNVVKEINMDACDRMPQYAR